MKFVICIENNPLWDFNMYRKEMTESELKQKLERIKFLITYKSKLI